jgi:cephalosporin-C deacetylase
MDLDKAAYQEIANYFRAFDPRHEREDEIFTTLGYIDLQFLAPRIKADLVMYTGLMDTICPPSTQFAAYNRITSPKQMVIYPDYGHEGYPDQSDLVYQFMMQL